MAFTSSRKIKSSIQLANNDFDWIECKNVFIKNGMLKAANSISQTMCKHCDKMSKNKKGHTRNYFFEIMDRNECNADFNKLNAWSEQINAKLKSEYGMWKKVYEKMPITNLSMVKF